MPIKYRVGGELLIARQMRGYELLGTIFLKHPTRQPGDVACCYVFTRSANGKKTSDSRYMEVKG